MSSFIGFLAVLLLSSTAIYSQGKFSSSQIDGNVTANNKPGLSVFITELKNGTACKEELLQMVCDNDQVLAVHSAIFDGSDNEGCGFMMPINLSSLLPDANNNSTNSSVDSRLFSVQSTVNRRYCTNSCCCSSSPVHSPTSFSIVYLRPR